MARYTVELKPADFSTADFQISPKTPYCYLCNPSEGVCALVDTSSADTTSARLPDKSTGLVCDELWT